MVNLNIFPTVPLPACTGWGFLKALLFLKSQRPKHFSALVSMASRKFQPTVSTDSACLSESFLLRFSCQFEVIFMSLVTVLVGRSEWRVQVPITTLGSLSEPHNPEDTCLQVRVRCEWPSGATTDSPWRCSILCWCSKWISFFWVIWNPSPLFYNWELNLLTLIIVFP